MYTTSNILVGLLLVSLSCALVEDRGSTLGGAVQKEVWDLSEDQTLQSVNWGGAGWEVLGSNASQEQIRGLTDFRIILAGEREVEGRFALTRVTMYRGKLIGASLDMNPSSASSAYENVSQLLKGLRADSEDHRRLKEWYAAGPVEGPGEQLNLPFLTGDGDPIVGIDIDWVWAGDSGKNWVVTLGFFWEAGLEAYSAQPD